jgi:general secretion pathway protein F
MNGEAHTLSFSVLNSRNTGIAVPNYTYRGLDKSGNQTTGQLTAENDRAALAQIKALGTFPTQVMLGREGPKSSARTAGVSAPAKMSYGRVGSADLAVVSRQLANLVAGGLPLMRTFTALTEHTENPRLKSALTLMQRDIQGGRTLWEALASYPKIFPPLYVNMVKAGEASGQLSSTLQWLADYLEKEQTQKTQIRSALAYPTLLVSVGSIAVFVLITTVVPKFVTIFEEFDQALPLPTVVLLAVSGFLASWWWAILCGLSAIVVGFRIYTQKPRGRMWADSWKLRLPLLGKLGLKSATSRFARTTATLLKGGVPLFDSMAVVRDVLGNEALARGVDQVREGMREGGSFAGRLEQTAVFPPLLTHMVGIGEETGDLLSVLETVANSFDVEVDATLKSAVSLLEPLIIITMGALIAFIILAMLLPVFQINLMGQ